MFKKLRFKFIAYTMTIFSFIVAIVIGGLYYYNFRQVDEKVNRVLDTTMLRVKNMSFKDYNPIKISPDEDRHFMWSFKVTTDGDVLGSPFQEISEELISKLIDQAKSNVDYAVYEDLQFEYRVENEEFAFVDVTEDMQRLSQVLNTSLLIGSAALIVVFISSTLLAKWAMKPVEESWRKQKEFVSDASHELRTPLTVILANAELLLEKQDETILENKVKVNYIQEEAKRMRDLVERLLFLAKSDQTQLTAHYTLVNVSQLIYELVLPMEVVAFEKQNFFDLEVVENIQATVDESLLKQLVIILLDNAMKYAAPKTNIIVRLTKQGMLSVTNFGTVIPQDKLERLFDRFYRVDASRHKETDGYGLGLSIAQTIANLHHTKIRVISNEKEGTQFSVDLNKTLI